jgi:hypothetical protein
LIRVVHCKREPFDLYIGRANGVLPESKWANQHVIGKHGTRAEVLAKYEDDVRGNPALMSTLHEIDDKVLGCWCKGTDGANDVPCHGDTLTKLREEQKRSASIIPCFTSHYSLFESILTFDEAAKTAPGNAVGVRAGDSRARCLPSNVIAPDDLYEGVNWRRT